MRERGALRLLSPLGQVAPAPLGEQRDNECCLRDDDRQRKGDLPPVLAPDGHVLEADFAIAPEAPLVQTTGTLGSWLGRQARLGRDDWRTVTITGMAAGFTVLFGAPLGGAVFALEILHRRGLEYYEALMPAVIGALCGYGTYVGLTNTLLSPLTFFAQIFGGLLADRAGYGIVFEISAALAVLSLVVLAAFVTEPGMGRSAGLAEEEMS